MDQRYHQFMRALTPPPCSEDVLWMLLKQAVTSSQDRLQLFVQLFPRNARPLQPLNGRVARDGE